jgi:hypothetical protein
MIQVCFYESSIFKEGLVMLSKVIQLYAILFLCIFVKHGTIAYQKLKLLQFPLSPLTCFMLIISIDVYEHSFHELTMRYSIFEKIYHSRVIPSFL